MPQVAHVAIVDDDFFVQTALASLLQAHGVDARTYGSAEDFLEALPSGRPDCLVVDLNMPNMSGLELQRELLRLGARIPTIVVSACGDKCYRDQCRVLGAVAYLVKPLHPDALISTITSAMRPNKPVQASDCLETDTNDTFYAQMPSDKHFGD